MSLVAEKGKIVYNTLSQLIILTWGPSVQRFRLLYSTVV